MVSSLMFEWINENDNLFLSLDQLLDLYHVGVGAGAIAAHVRKYGYGRDIT